ncbi:hypothetical protein BASA61_005058 [Batrachochytrium salamandrivorans]|nr:hypothetical protein BASA62_003562 [Batrachochytrium salamandrivorans]KAH6580531.1 hypothetical protein BASA60_002816 [Batrachochytrium salamandrivorans]KAH6591158.1 hypothetical protein BASA61_005058 [Batrachochytrium salamandrivorans]KAH9248144.1 hypothetical protein BASA81_014218 [Batrachochytrium salamandrivorans]KAH9265492.1 hypothetical protein BASA83_011087 [Batrachochytrium salamandrivorans]
MAYEPPNINGNCVSGRISFDPKRTEMVPMPAGMPAYPPSVMDVALVDATIDYAAQNVHFVEGGGVELRLVKSNNASAVGTRISLSRYLLYARITARIKAIPVAGVITTFITMSDTKDEIDWEVVGSDTNNAQTNVFYKGIEEFGIHSTTEPVKNISTWHNYTMDWKHDTLTWEMDGEVRRTLNRLNSTSPMTPEGEHWYPTTASRVQISVWDGGASGNKGTSDWAGGKIPWGSQAVLSAKYDWIDIQCYDNEDQPVPKWPIDSFNPDRQMASTTVSTVSVTGVAKSVGNGTYSTLVLTPATTMHLARHTPSPPIPAITPVSPLAGNESPPIISGTQSHRPVIGLMTMTMLAASAISFFITLAV